MKSFHRPAFIAVLVVVALSLTGCTKVMDAGKVEKSSKSFLKGKIGTSTIDKVKCPSNKKAKADTSFTCTFTGSNSVTGTVKVAVTSSDGDATITLDSLKYGKDYVESAIKAEFTKEYPDQASALSDVTCPDDLSSDASDGITCTLSDNTGQKGDLKVTLGEDGAPSFDLSSVTASAG